MESSSFFRHIIQMSLSKISSFRNTEIHHCSVCLHLSNSKLKLLPSFIRNFLPNCLFTDFHLHWMINLNFLLEQNGVYLISDFASESFLFLLSHQKLSEILVQYSFKNVSQHYEINMRHFPCEFQFNWCLFMQNAHVYIYVYSPLQCDNSSNRTQIFNWKFCFNLYKISLLHILNISGKVFGSLNQIL